MYFIVVDRVHVLYTDVVIALDISGSVSSSEFTAQRNGAIQIVEALFQNKKASDVISISGITYSSNASSEFNHSMNLLRTTQVLRNIPYRTSGSSYLRFALQFALNFFEDHKNADKSKRKALLVIADDTLGGNFTTCPQLDRLQKMNVKVTAAFVGVQQSNAEKICFGRDESFFFNTFNKISLSAVHIASNLSK